MEEASPDLVPPDRKPGSYRDLVVYRESYALALDVHRATIEFPPAERYLLADQMRRASRSIPANLAEGWGVHTKANFAHYVSQALGSANEMLVHVDLAKDLGYLPEQTYKQLTSDYDRLGRRLYRLRERLTS